MSDIRIYNFEFSLVGILPEEQCNSINYKKDFNGIGSFEIDFRSDKIANIVTNYCDTLFLEYDGFQGYFTGYWIDDKICKIYGKHLNGLLHKFVIPTYPETTGNPETMAKEQVSANCTFLEVSEESAGTDIEVTFEKENYASADAFLSELLELANAGYEIRADIKQKKFIFEVLKSKETSLILSENNLNAYEFETVYDNKEQAFGGWYKKKIEEPAEGEPDYEWTYLSESEKEGIYREDTVLNASTEAEARQELQAKQATLKLNCSTKKIKYLTDYNLGDIVKVQQKNKTVKKRIVSVSVSQETDRQETPTFSEV